MAPLRSNTANRRDMLPENSRYVASRTGDNVASRLQIYPLKKYLIGALLPATHLPLVLTSHYTTFH